MLLPSHDAALATAYKSYETIRHIADRLALDDPDWIYSVRRRPDGMYVIEVRDGQDDDELFLGYL